MARRSLHPAEAEAAPGGAGAWGAWGPAPAEDEPEARAREAEARGPGPLRFPCPSCGATLAYAPGERVLVCAFCGTESPAPDAVFGAEEALRERDDLQALAEDEAGAALETTQTVHCDDCGADLDFDPLREADACPFCAAPLVAPPRADRHIRPQALSPFAIDEREAAERVRRWLSGRWFAPSALTRYARPGRLVGVYVPWWTFDAQVESAYAGQRGDLHAGRAGLGRKGRAARRVRWRPASGRLSRLFDDLPVPGSASLGAAEERALGDFDLAHLEPYDLEALEGFRREVYATGLRRAFAAARDEMDRVIAREVRRDIGGDRQRLLRLDSRASEVRFRHVLLPVWIGAYRHRGRVRRVLVNGRSGAVVGERPWAIWKIGLAVLAVLLLLGGLAAAAALVLGGR